MKSWSLILVLAVAVSAVASAQDAVTLNGLMTAFDQKYALFKVDAPGSPSGQNYILKEGQKRGDLELVSIDTTARTVTIRNHGVIQAIDICPEPKLVYTVDASQGNNGVRPGSESEVMAWLQTQAVASQNSVGGSTAPVYGHVVGSATSPNPPSNDGAGGDAAASASAADGNGFGGVDVSKPAPKLDPWWIRGSQTVEAARIQSAQAVLDGKADPQPLTPLTPPGTPAVLIGPEQLFFDHM